MNSHTITMGLDPSAPRQLGEEGLIVLWRNGMKPERREGLACILSICPCPDCAGQLVYLDGFVIDDQATKVCWESEGVYLVLPAGSEPTRVVLEERMIAVVDPSSGETEAHPDLPDATDPALIEWLASEMDGELLDVLHRFLARAKGYPLEAPKKDIDLDDVEEVHLASFDQLFDGVRGDDYLLGGRRYWSCIYLCPYSDCDCHEVHVVFFDDAADKDAAENGESVGSVLLELSGDGGFRIVEMEAECGAPEHLIKDLWALFQRRYDVARFLRRREAQFKAVGETLWRPRVEPVHSFPRPGRNDPCPCGSGRKFKKCCLGKEGGTPIPESPSRRVQ